VRYPTPEEGSCPSCCSTPPAAVAHPPPCRSSTPAGRRATRGCATPRTHRRPRRSSPSCATPGDGAHGRRLRGLIVVLWRAGLRICEALALTEADLDPRRGSLLVRRGKGGRRREVGMDDWAWEQLAPWLQARVALPVAPLYCVVNGPTRGRPWASAAARSELRRVAREARVRRRFAPHQPRHAHAVEMAREGVALLVIQRQLGHTNLGITSIYLQGIDNTEIIDTVHARRAPMVPVHSSLRL
jgi:site-specific recombinase XerD